MSEQDYSVESLANRVSGFEKRENDTARMQQEVERRRRELGGEREAWVKDYSEFQKKVKSGEVSTGDPFQNYVIATHNFLPSDWNEMPEKARMIEYIGNKLSSTKKFWYQTRHGDDGAYELLFLGEDPLSVSSTRMSLRSNASVSVYLEELFEKRNGGPIWPFIQKHDAPNEIEVRLESEYIGEDSRRYNRPIISSERCDVENLEKKISANPLVALRSAEVLGRPVEEELQTLAAEYVHATATRALDTLQRRYMRARQRSRALHEIHSLEMPEDYFAQPFMVQAEVRNPTPDGTLEEIRNGGYFDEVRTLVETLIDLDRTGLVNYTLPIEKQLSVGERTVSNLAEVANHVKTALFIWNEQTKEKKEAS